MEYRTFYRAQTLDEEMKELVYIKENLNMDPEKTFKIMQHISMQHKEEWEAFLKKIYEDVYKKFSEL